MTTRITPLVTAGILSITFAAAANPAVPEIVLNEVSSSTLTYSIAGGPLQTVTDITPDHWDFSVTQQIVTSLGGVQDLFVQWEEPDYATSGEVNLVRFQQNSGGTEITVTSDYTPDPAHTYLTVANGALVNFSNDNPNPPVSGGLVALYNDNGDGVPDAGSTLALAGLGLAGLGLLRRKLS